MPSKCTHVLALKYLESSLYTLCEHKVCSPVSQIVDDEILVNVVEKTVLKERPNVMGIRQVQYRFFKCLSSKCSHHI